MPLPLIPILEGLAADALVRAGRALLTKMPWAKDAAKTEAVEARIRRLAADATQLARNLPDDAIEPQVSRLLEQFQKELPSLGMTAVQAADLVEVEREQLQATVIEAARERRQTLKWLQELEERAHQAEKSLRESEATAKRVEELEKKLARMNVLLNSVLTLSIVALLIGVLCMVVKK